MNLLRNPGFEDGYYHHEGIPELTIPNEWTFWNADRTVAHPMDGDPNRRPWDEWLRPESVVWHIINAPANERGLLFRNGAYNLKVFKGHGAMWAAFSQTVALPAGGYRFTVPIYPDLVISYSGSEKIYAPDVMSGEAMLRAKGATVDTTLGWLNGNTLRFGAYNVVTMDFTVDTTQDVTLTFAMRGRHALRNTGFFVDAVSLEPHDVAPPPPPVSDADKTAMLATINEIENELATHSNRVNAQLTALRQTINGA